MLVRPGRASGKPSWADVQWWVKPVASEKQASEKQASKSENNMQGQRRDSMWRLSVTLKRCRGGEVGKTVHVICH